MNGIYQWRTLQVVKETAHSVTIIFDTQGEKFEYQSGQFINLTLLINNIPVTRSYSLSSSPHVDKYPAITVKKVGEGVMSNFIVNNAEGVKLWQIEGPYGSFTPPADSSHLFLLAGGSGITPLFSIAKTIVSQRKDIKVTILYANKTANDIIFVNALTEWQKQEGERINVIYALSNDDGRTAIPAESVIIGRFNRIIVKKLIRQFQLNTKEPVHYFICGPSALMKIYEESLQALQVNADQIFVERFIPDDSQSLFSVPDVSHEVMLHFYERSYLLDVAPGNTILQAALEDRVPLPYSCKQGTCGKCAAVTVAGDVRMHHNYALQRQQVDTGWVLLCQSYPFDDSVTVQVG
jgi:ring-1,2-phenylacetyl-CoA epoxidase subunit PaaE